MKITLLFLFLGISNVFSTTYSQSKLLTLDLKGRPIQEMIHLIEEQSEYVFFFSDEVAPEIRQRVTVQAKGETIDKILDDVFKETNLTYRIKDRQVSITRSAEKTAPPASVTSVPQQERHTVTGVVKDESGEPLPGATVMVQGSTRGVSTDIDGTFVLSVSSSDKLIFGYLGMQEQTIPVGKQTVINVTMKEKVDELSEVAVVAFARQKKESVVSSITTVRPSELKVPSSNLTTAFAGRIAGMIAYQRSGEPGRDNAEFFIRGITTFGDGSANPLILIDNVELGADDLSRMNPDDIASFSVLKDAAATALYGARGANGVILVTTKEGREGKVSISFRVENSISSSVRNIQVADPITFMKLHNEAVRTRDPLAALPYLDSEIAAREEGRNPYVYPVVDWMDMLFKDHTMNQRGNLSLSGGGNVARYYVALTYARDNGILSVDPVNNFNNNIKLNKYSVRSNVNLKLSKTTELAVRVNGTFDDYQGPITGGKQMYNNAIKSNPVLFPATYAPDQANIYTKHILFGNSGTGEYMNPYAEMLRGYKETQTTVVVAQLELKQNLDLITKGLRARLLGTTTRNSGFGLNRGYNPFYYSIGGYDKMTDVYTLTALNPDSGTDYLNYKPGDKTVSSSMYMEASLSYNRTFRDKHAVSGMLVYTARESLSANEELLQNSLPLRNLGLAGRFTYGLNGRYFAEFNFGYNGSERFAKHNRWGFFPSGGVGWIVSKESFWENSVLSNAIQLFKLKGTYGLVGNDKISNDRFFYLSEVNMKDSGKSYQFGTDFNTSRDGIAIDRYADDRIGWEVAHKLNLGVELRLFDHLEIHADYFREKRTNILQERKDIPTLMGLQAKPKANIGEAKGSGVDFSVDYQTFFSKDFWLTVRGNFTYATSKYTIFEEPDYSATTPWLSQVGNKIKQGYGLIAERLFVDDEEVLNAPRQQFGNYMGGDIKYKDINKDGVIDSRDVVPIGYPTVPEIIYGFGFSTGYKNFDLSCFFQGSARSSFWISPGAVTPFINSLGSKTGNNAVLKFIEEDHWSEANQNVYAQWPRLAGYTVGNNTQRSTWFMRNGNFIRLKSAEFGYKLPAEIVQKARIANLRIYLSGTNLLCFSNFKLWDPEMGGDGLGYPLQRVYNIGLQVSF